MNITQEKTKMLENIDEIISFYKRMEKEHGINLTREVNHAIIVLEDIEEATWKANNKEVWL